MSVRLSILIADTAWDPQALRPALRKAVRKTLMTEGRDGALTLLLTHDAALRALNRDFRGKDKPTNVLSFPAPANPEGHLGDIALAYETAHGEAETARLPFAHHVLHLAVHGTLHLLGYDHETDAQAAVMQPKEIAILAALGIADPYGTEA